VVRALEIPPEGQTVRGLHVQTVHVFETPERLPGDEVTIIHLCAEDMHVVFLGDLGHALTEDELAPLRGADIVLAAAGGPPTIDFPEIPPLLEAIGPRLIFPMHYKTPKINLNIQPLERFLAVLPGVPVDRPGSSRYEVSRDTLPREPRIVVLEHAR
jgi:L-ascorbate metabolism protein UlaG (beta-lactamase superfamily)